MVRARTLARVLAVVAMALMWPAGASAESDVISWLDSLSGPGPFYVRIPSISGQDQKLICAAKKDIHPFWADQFENGGDRWPCLTNSNEIKWYLSVHVDFLTTYDQNQFNEATKRSVNAQVLEAVWRWRLDKSFDAGLAVGWTGFTDGRDQSTFSRVNRFTLTPVTIMLRPGEWFKDNRWTRAVALRFNEAILFGDVTSAGFGGAPGVFSRGTELNGRWALTFDWLVAGIH